MHLLLSFFSCFIFAICFNSSANNIKVSNVQRDTLNFPQKWVQVKFDLTWENSWRTSLGPANWDAAWVFVKFKVGGSNPQFSNINSTTDTIIVSSTSALRVGMPVRIMSGTGNLQSNTVISSIASDTKFVLSSAPSAALSGATIECIRIWEHAWLDTTDARHVAPTGATIQVPADSAGAFIYRSTTGYGTFSLEGVRLRWNFGSNGVTGSDTVDVRVYAIEMVYVPQGSFYLGSFTVNDSLPGSFRAGSTNDSYQITSSDLVIDQHTGLWFLDFESTIHNDDNLSVSGSFNSFPNGFNAMYAMKYEMSQGHYRDFLNSLTYWQQQNRTETSPNGAPGTAALGNFYRNGIDIQSSGNQTLLEPAIYGCNLDGDSTFNEDHDGEWIACNLLSWVDACAYLDWSGLRPFTELEFEKICRGPLKPEVFDYAWGTEYVQHGAYSLSNPGTAAERISVNYASASEIGNSLIDTTIGAIGGPVRCGIFAANILNKGRISSGASYYGVMELSGNLWEQTVFAGSAEGLSFAGDHGNGSLSASGPFAGCANVNSWPGFNAGVGSVIGAEGAGRRGGGGYNCKSPCQKDAYVSSRCFAGAYDFQNSRSQCVGVRGVRTAF